MRQTVEQYIADSQELCVLPDIYLKLKKLIADENATLADIAEVLSLEPAIASKLLKIANSSIFGFPREVVSIDRALMILGTKEVENLIEAYGITAAFSGIDPNIADMDRFWEISVDCALLTKFFAQKLNLPNAESLFLSGLFHNIGALILVHLAPKQVKYSEGYNKSETPWERQKDVLGFTYSDLSAALLTSWQLPTLIVEPIAQYQDAYQNELSDSASLLFVTTRLALINSHPGMYAKKTFLGTHLLEKLGLSSDDIEEGLRYCNQQGVEILAVLELI
ncbi:HDOD domain-containing protein [Thalassotalea sediminis]|uniref:HDOD domain-containing protein n=1 Tax=Thalassotalea sediminis TaxID=1759089 RepID=UPI0025734A1B|nr:HDOD domain-containing protein [Thalassotalea sediminis]